MSLSGGASKNNSSSSTTYTPNAANQALFNPVFNAASADINKPVQAYTQPMTAGLAPEQIAAQGLLGQSLGTGQSALASGVAGAQGLLGFNPQQVHAPTITASQTGPTALAGAAGYNPSQSQSVQAGPAAMAQGNGYGAVMTSGAQAGPAALSDAAGVNRSNIGNVGGGLLDTSRISALMNPYTSSVVDTTLNDIDRSRQMAIAGDQGRFTQAGAFGGSREGVADSLTNEAAIRAAASAAANLNSQGYAQALGTADTEAGRTQAGQQSNQAADLTTAGQNANLQQSANLANSAAQNSMGQFNAGLLADTNNTNAAAQNQAGAFGAAASNAASAQNAGAANAQSQFNAGLLGQNNQFNATEQNQAGLYGAQAQNAASGQNAAAINANQQFNTGIAQQTGVTNAANALTAGQSNQSAGLAGAGIQANASGLLGSLGLGQNNISQQDIAAMQQAGLIDQNTSNAQLQAAYAEFQRQQNMPLQQAAANTGLLGTIPAAFAGANTTGKGQQTSTGLGFSWQPKG